MLKEERQQKILDLLNLEQKVIASDLSQAFSVSEDTIRRDLKELDQKGLLRRVHSGALRKGPPITDFDHRQSVASDTKKALAQKALPLLKENTVIMIDGGTTNLHLIKLLPIDFQGTIITNSPSAAMELAHHDNIEVIMLGGTLHKKSMANLGVDTIDALSLMRVDLYVMGIHNIDSQNGISVPTLLESQVKRAMSKISAEIIALVISDKLETVSNNIVGPAQELTYLVTDNTNPYIYKAYSTLDITILNP